MAAKVSLARDRDGEPVPRSVDATGGNFAQVRLSTATFRARKKPGDRAHHDSPPVSIPLHFDMSRRRATNHSVGACQKKFVA
jgi:hypothetical protein